MHQPFYKDLLTGEYRLPWTRMHALKDYYGMVNVLRDFPDVRQTFNLVPSVVVQIDEYAKGEAVDPFLRTALKPSDELTESDQDFILQYFFQAHPARMIYRWPRYGQLLDIWHAADRNPKRARRVFGVQEFRDLQVLSQLAWFDEDDFTGDPDVRALMAKGRGFDAHDQALVGVKQLLALNRVLPAYKDFAARGQIEISATPFYHPILPLLCDSNIAEASHPYVPLPSHFSYPQDAAEQLHRAREFTAREFGKAPVGLWPSEGSVSDHALALAAENGFQWAASDNGVLARTLQRDAVPSVTYRPYRWEQMGNQIKMIFRDHHLSDLIGFVYARMDPVEAAAHFLHQIRENCAPILAEGRDALVPIILDGENAWEYYDRNGRPFLRELYRRISEDHQMSAVTVSEGLARVPAEPIAHIFPGSWINANFDIWIGAEEDNRAWDCLLRARRAYDASRNIPDAQRALAFEELLIAEGSDWCWWYGPEHESANRAEFDQLFRDHLANVYRALNIAPPDDLSRPILKVEPKASHDLPTGLISPTIDGDVTSYFEWLGAGHYKVDERSGAMHGQRFLIRDLYYGSDGPSIYLRLDFESRMENGMANLRISPAHDGARATEASLPVMPGGAGTVGEIAYAYSSIFEIRVPLAAIGASERQPVRFQISIWQDGLPLDALPQQGWLEVQTAEPTVWGF